MTDIELARHLAAGAAKILLDLRARGDLSGKELGKEGDRQANAWLMNEVARERPDDGVLSEETKDTPERLGKSRVWIIDPLDGTREYSEGRDDWAVHIGLAIDGRAASGAVALPGMGETLDSGAPPALAAAADTPRMLVSRTRPAAEAVAVAKAIGADLVPMGSAGAKAMAVVRGEAEIYLHSGGQFEWDNCAPVAVAQAAGLHVSRIDGSPLAYNCEDTYLPDLLICRKEWADTVLELVAQIDR
ncbi:3'(2'),5'-bisphosphate nucleotidase CysQ [Novosphingobium sp. ZN18A2]|uniref:3'(2'),5'-bisphosphate nucleotidase CysQ n=1 Tax=Novosphingobium sp. ZN18A2 TaxID=3079861 RepID=UPI0030D102F3